MYRTRDEIRVHISTLGLGRVGERATPHARPTLPSSNRRCRFPTSGSPESSRLRHAQYPIGGSAPTSPGAVAIALLPGDGTVAGCVVANAGPDGPEHSVRSHSRHWMGIRRKSSSSSLSGADSAPQSGPGSAYGFDDYSSSPVASRAPAGSLSSTETHSGSFDRVLSDHGRSEMCNPRNSDLPLFPAGPPPASFPG